MSPRIFCLAAALLARAADGSRAVVAAAADATASPGSSGFLGVLRAAAERSGIASLAELRGLEAVQVKEAALKESNHFRNPKVWGPVFWFFLHDSAFAQDQEIPEDQQERLRTWYTEEVPGLLPCDECQERTRKVIKSLQPIPSETWSNRTNLIYWVIMFHNHVNLDMERPVVPPERVIGHYVEMFDPYLSGKDAQPVAITFDPSVDAGKDPQTAFPKKWKPGGIDTPEIIMFRMPAVWGPVGWFLLESLALAQDDSKPVHHKEALVNFYTKKAGHVLPCPHCGMHLRGHLSSGRAPLPESNMSRLELVHWVHDLHNVVNREKKFPTSEFAWNKFVEGITWQYTIGPPVDAYLGNGPLKTPPGIHAEGVRSSCSRATAHAAAVLLAVAALP